MAGAGEEGVAGAQPSSEPLQQQVSPASGQACHGQTAGWLCRAPALGRRSPPRRRRARRRHPPHAPLACVLLCASHLICGMQVSKQRPLEFLDLPLEVLCSIANRLEPPDRRATCLKLRAEGVKISRRGARQWVATSMLW